MRDESLGFRGFLGLGNRVREEGCRVEDLLHDGVQNGWLGIFSTADDRGAYVLRKGAFVSGLGSLRGTREYKAKDLTQHGEPLPSPYPRKPSNP